MRRGHAPSTVGARTKVPAGHHRHGSTGPRRVVERPRERRLRLVNLGTGATVVQAGADESTPRSPPASSAARSGCGGRYAQFDVAASVAAAACIAGGVAVAAAGTPSAPAPNRSHDGDSTASGNPSSHDSDGDDADDGDDDGAGDPDDGAGEDGVARDG